jgi:hypothetical protein
MISTRALVFVRRVRRREQPRDARVQRRDVDGAMRRQALDQLEQAFGVVGHGQASVQRRAAQAAPQRLHPGRERHGARGVALVEQDAGHLAQALEFVGAQHGLRRRGLWRFRRRVEQGALWRARGRGGRDLRRNAQRTLQQHRHRGDVIVAEQALQRGQRQAAIRRSQHRQPGQAVARMGQGPHQLHQVRHHRPQGQRHQVHRPAAYALLRQPAGQVAQVAARPHQHGDGVFGALVVDQRLAHQAHPRCPRPAFPPGPRLRATRPDGSARRAQARLREKRWTGCRQWRPPPRRCGAAAIARTTD